MKGGVAGWGRNDAPLARAPQKEKLPLVTTLANVLQMGPPSEAAPAPAAAKPRKVPPAPLLRDTVVLGALVPPPAPRPARCYGAAGTPIGTFA